MSVVFQASFVHTVCVAAVSLGEGLRITPRGRMPSSALLGSATRVDLFGQPTSAARRHFASGESSELTAFLSALSSRISHVLCVFFACCLAFLLFSGLVRLTSQAHIIRGRFRPAVSAQPFCIQAVGGQLPRHLSLPAGFSHSQGLYLLRQQCVDHAVGRSRPLLIYLCLAPFIRVVHVPLG